MEVNFYKVPDKDSTFGSETFLRKVFAVTAPRVGELVGFDDSIESYRVLDVSHYYKEEDEDESIEVLVVNSDKW
jgi:hypothetical protein